MNLAKNNDWIFSKVTSVEQNIIMNDLKAEFIFNLFKKTIKKIFVNKKKIVYR